MMSLIFTAVLLTYRRPFQLTAPSWELADDGDRVTPLREDGRMCAICEGATEDEVRQHLAESIDWYGWSIQGVEAGPESWGWAYTVGLTERFNHPELVVASKLEFGAIGQLLNILGDEIQLGRRFRAGDRATVAGTDLAFVAVHQRQFEHQVFDMWFDHYRAFSESSDLTALQVLLPSRYFCADHDPQPRLDRPEDVLNRPGGNRAARRARERRSRNRRPPTRPR